DLAFVEGHAVTQFHCVFSEGTGLDFVLLHVVFVAAEAFREVLCFLHVDSRSYPAPGIFDDVDLQILDNILWSYDRRITPSHHLNAPTIVKCEIYLRSFGAVNPATM
ncbi:hypothetical protein HPB47_008764, partial [Ixodes persulcatus]